MKIRLQSLQTVVLAFVFCICAASAPLIAQCFMEDGPTIYPSELGTTRGMGASLALDGEWAAIGAPYHHAGLSYAGSAYLYKKVNGSWQEQQQIHPNDSHEVGQFGTSLSMDGDILVVGAPTSLVTHNDQGAAYVYRRSGDTWQQEQTLLADNPQPWALYGLKVAVSGNRILVSASDEHELMPEFQPFIQRIGTVYAYEYDGSQWIQTQKIFAPIPTYFGRFGYDLAMEGDLALVGALLPNNAVYAMHHNGSQWVHEQSMEHEASQGVAVALNGNTAVIGIPRADGPAGEHWAGAAYVYNRIANTWVESQTIPPFDPTIRAFGANIGIDGNHMVMTAAGSGLGHGGGGGSGEVYTYEFDGSDWNFSQQIKEAVSPWPIMSWIATIEGENILIGSSDDSTNGEDVGSANFFKYSSDCESKFRRGDANGDQLFDIADAIAVLSYVFVGDFSPCEKAIDGNDDGAIDLADAITLLGALFGDGQLPAPYLCEYDLTPDSLGCNLYNCP